MSTPSCGGRLPTISRDDYEVGSFEYHLCTVLQYMNNEPCADLSAQLIMDSSKVIHDFSKFLPNRGPETSKQAKLAGRLSELLQIVGASNFTSLGLCVKTAAARAIGDMCYWNRQYSSQLVGCHGLRALCLLMDRICIKESIETSLEHAKCATETSPIPSTEICSDSEIEPSIIPGANSVEEQKMLLAVQTIRIFNNIAFHWDLHDALEKAGALRRVVAHFSLIPMTAPYSNVARESHDSVSTEKERKLPLERIVAMSCGVIYHVSYNAAKHGCLIGLGVVAPLNWLLRSRRQDLHFVRGAMALCNLVGREEEEYSLTPMASLLSECFIGVLSASLAAQPYPTGSNTLNPIQNILISIDQFCSVDTNKVPLVRAGIIPLLSRVIERSKCNTEVKGHHSGVVLSEHDSEQADAKDDFRDVFAVTDRGIQVAIAIVWALALFDPTRENVSEQIELRTLLTDLASSGRASAKVRREADSVLWLLNHDVSTTAARQGTEKHSSVDLRNLADSSSDAAQVTNLDTLILKSETATADSTGSNAVHVATDANATPTPQSGDQTTPTHMDGHIMLSYSWANQPAVLLLKKDLEDAGHRVWMDVDQMSGSTLEAMANAVEDSSIVCVCVSKAYKDSVNCRTEAEYAYNLRKRIVPVMMQSAYRADGWLGALLGTKLWFDLSSMDIFADGLKALMRELPRPRPRSLSLPSGGGSMTNKDDTNIRRSTSEPHVAGAGAAGAASVHTNSVNPTPHVQRMKSSPFPLASAHGPHGCGTTACNDDTTAVASTTDTKTPDGFDVVVWLQSIGFKSQRAQRTIQEVVDNDRSDIDIDVVLGLVSTIGTPIEGSMLARFAASLDVDDIGDQLRLRLALSRLSVSVGD